MNNLLAPVMQLLRRPPTTTFAPPLQVRISASAPPLQLRISTSAPPLQLRISATALPPLRIKCSKPSEDRQKPLPAKKKKGLLKARRKGLKSFRKRLAKAVEELRVARALKREGLSGTRGSPSWKVEKAFRAENVEKKKSQGR